MVGSAAIKQDQSANRKHTFVYLILWRCGVMCIIGFCNLLYVLWKLQNLPYVYESSIV